MCAFMGFQFGFGLMIGFLVSFFAFLFVYFRVIEKGRKESDEKWIKILDERLKAQASECELEITALKMSNESKEGTIQTLRKENEGIWKRIQELQRGVGKQVAS